MRRAILAASFVVAAGGGCKKKSVTKIEERTVVRDGRCVVLSSCDYVVNYDYPKPPTCADPIPAPRIVDCPLHNTARLADGNCYFPHDLVGKDQLSGNTSNPPGPPIPQRVACPDGVKDYVPSKHDNDLGIMMKKAAASASASASASSK